MVLSWNEIRDRAIKFSKEWENETREDAEGKSFLDDFFNVFGIHRRRVATFETKVKKINGKDGYIDLLWKEMILIEQKSRGQNLDKAYSQAKDYFPGLKENELPKYILVSDFERFRLYDLDENVQHDFILKDFYKNIKLFGKIAGYNKTTIKPQDPVNIDAALRLGKLHDKLKAIGYKGHNLEVYLVRILFCLFADDSTIFEKNIFQDYVKLRTSEDGNDLAPHLSQLFQILNTPEGERLKNIDDLLKAFPYVNGKLFDEPLPVASFDSEMREILLYCCELDWSKISPAIFGSMFQGVMNPEERRNLGAHYTSEKNILKLIKPLFLDDLWSELNAAKSNKQKLLEFHKKLSTLKFLDPACGCGNFLVITYRELRLLELELLKQLHKTQQATTIEQIIWIDVDQFYGIEYDEWPAQIAQVAMWLIDHQMNMAISNEFGEYFVRLPLKKAVNIVNADALEINWETIVSPKELSYILGNPPFIGSKFMKQNQRESIVKLFDKIDGSGILDYVTGWYMKAAKFIQNTEIKVAFVSTNSIVQGEQTSVLWGQMLNKYNIKINFAHRTFKWSNEAKGNAGVYCVIIGFAIIESSNKLIFEYDDVKGEPHELNKIKNINPYLVDAKNIFITKRSTPINKVPKIKFGNQPIDGGFLLLEESERVLALKEEPGLSKFIRKYVGSDEFINNIPRYCLWLKEATPTDLRNSKFISTRLQQVKTFRLSSNRKETKELANVPSQFAFTSHNETEYIIIPSVSSERRKFIPIGFMSPKVIASNLCLIIPDAKLFHFGVLTSTMHMSWVKTVCGRLESRFRYSNSIVYNNFPWPQNPSEKQIKAIEDSAQRILDVRLNFPKSSLADLYDPLAMPVDLIKAHRELDKVVDLAYRPQPFPSEVNRLEFLFELYERYTADLFTTEKPTKKKK